MPGGTDSDIKELHNKANTISLDLAKFAGRVEGTLEHLATKSDIGEIVGTAIDRQSAACSNRYQPKGRTSIAPNGSSPKTVAALAAAITAAVGALVAVIYKLIG